MVVLFAITWVFFVYRDDPYVDSEHAGGRRLGMEPGVSAIPATIERGAKPRTAKSPAPTARLTVDVKRDLDLRPEDAAAIDALIESRPQAGVFLSKTWLSGFFAEPPTSPRPWPVLLR